MKEILCSKIKRKNFINNLQKDFTSSYPIKKEEIQNPNITKHDDFIYHFEEKEHHIEHHHIVQDNIDTITFLLVTKKLIQYRETFLYHLIKEKWSTTLQSKIHDTKEIAKLDIETQTLSIYQEQYYQYFKDLSLNLHHYTNDFHISILEKCWEGATIDN